MNISENAIYHGGPSKERLVEIREEFPISADGWIYRKLSDGRLQRWQRWAEWGPPGTNGKPYAIVGRWK